jgi:integrase
MDTQLTTYQGIDALGMIAGAAHLAESTRSKYRREVERAIDAGIDLFDAEQLVDYAAGLSDSGRAFLKASVKLVSEQIANSAKAQADPSNVAAVQAVVYRVEALQDAITTSTPKGQKAHTWLSQSEVKRLLDSCSDDLQGQRDRLALGLMVAAGLRRSEAVGLTFGDVRLQPVGDRMRTVLQICGKGSKSRVVPISDRLANAIDDWSRVTGLTEGPILRGFDQRRELRESMSTTALYRLVQRHGSAIGKPDLQPHDLRRSYSQLGYDAGVPVTQISTLLGHASIQTTQRYLNLDLNLTETVSDFVPF